MLVYENESNEEKKEDLLNNQANNPEPNILTSFDDTCSSRSSLKFNFFIYIFLPFLEEKTHEVRAFEMSSCSDSQLICPLKVQHKNNNYNKIIFLPRGRLHCLDEHSSAIRFKQQFV